MSEHSTTDKNDEAFIPASKSLPEITLKGIILAILLTIALAAANAYLGLKVGTTVSASIPAAVLSMGILRLFKNSNILENNIVQTAASSGEALVAGIAYIVPALIILHYWNNFNYWQTSLIAIIGGTLGVLFSVPLRRVLLAEKTLRFPEGTAIGNVLKASALGSKNIKHLVYGGTVGSIISFSQTGLKVLSGSLQAWGTVGGSVVGFGLGFDPALIGAGYIIGINVAMSIFLGVFVAWLVGIPVFTYLHGIPVPGHPVASAMNIWQNQIRYVGVGMMMVGGLWTLVSFGKPMYQGIRASFKSVKLLNHPGKQPTPRTERDIPIHYVSLVIGLICLPLFLLFWHFTDPAHFAITPALRISTTVFAVIYAIVAGFIFSSICGYFTGLVGSTNNPLSGMTLCALIIVSLSIFALLDPTLHFTHNPGAMTNASVLAIVIAAVVASAAAISNDTVQDLKAGQMVGATPWKQQFMLIIGVIIASLTIPYVLNLLFNAYGIGGVFPRPGMDPSQMLAAPQAGLMAALVQGVFGHNLPWTPIILGWLFAAICIVIDSKLKQRGSRLPVLAVALGVYLPLEASMPCVMGGVLSYLVERSLQKHKTTTENYDDAHQRGLITACGLVAGAALMGVILAIPFALEKSSDALKIVPHGFRPTATVLSLIVTILLMTWVYRVVCKRQK